MMRCKLGFVLLATTLAGCSHVPYDEPSRGMSPVNVPVLTRSEYVFDAAAPDGNLSHAERARLDGWFASLGLGYGDSIYVDGPYADAARGDVALAAGRYGLMLSNGAPVTAGAVEPGMVRVVVTRTRAEVPNCPNWSEPAQPNFANHSMSNLGCSVNSNLASMVANPEDLIHGRDGSAVGDTRTSSKAIQAYRSAAPTGSTGLKDISTKKKDN